VSVYGKLKLLKIWQHKYSLFFTSTANNERKLY